VVGDTLPPRVSASRDAPARTPADPPPTTRPCLSQAEQRDVPTVRAQRRSFFRSGRRSGELARARCHRSERLLPDTTEHLPARLRRALRRRQRRRREERLHFTRPRFAHGSNGSNGSNGSVSIGGWVGPPFRRFPPVFGSAARRPPPRPRKVRVGRSGGSIPTSARPQGRARVPAAALSHTASRADDNVRAYTGGTTHVDHVG
jgi:hypothetical protein